MHVFQCGWCGTCYHSYFPPERHVSPDNRLIDVVPVYCTCRMPIRMYYLGLHQPAPMQMNLNAPAFQPTPPRPNNPVHAAPLQPNAPQRQPDPVPAPTRYAIQDLDPEHYNEALKLVLGYMGEKDVLAFRMLNHAHRDLAERVMKGWFTPDRFKYAASGRMKMDTFIKQQIDLAQSVRVSVDQLTDPDLLELLVGGNDQIDKVKGVNAGRLASTGQGRNKRTKTFDDTFGQFSDRSAVIELPGNEKMHNKFYLVGPQGVITGSPNLSHAGLRDNQECIIFIRHPMVAILFREYFERIRSNGAARLRNDVQPDPYDGPLPEAFTGQINRFNRDSPVRVALAPFLNIRDFVYEELQGATGATDVKITMRQFVVDQPGENQKDILKALMDLARQGAKVEVVLDYEQYRETGFFDRNTRQKVYFVQEAVNQLKAAGVTVYLQKSGNNIMHEKLLLIQFTKNDTITKTALLGSAGFTKNVSENLNYENIIAIDEDEIYDYFMQWHVDSITPARRLATTFKVGDNGPTRL